MNNDLKTIKLLSHLRNLGIELKVEKDKMIINAPKGVITRSLHEDLSQRKTEIMRFLAGSATSIGSESIPLQPVSRDGILPVSFSQQRLWFLSQMEPDSTAYVIQGGIRMQGKLNVEALERSLREIYRRHEVLRTTVQEKDGRPAQVISPPTGIALPIVDLQELPEDEREAEVQSRFFEEAQQFFDLAQGPLLSVKLMRLREEEHMFLLTIHHIISDGWSQEVFLREIGALYPAFCSGQPSPLPELSIQYADYAVWQREWLQGKVLEGQLAYWKRRLGGDELPLLQLPTDRPRPAVQTYVGAETSFVLSEHLKNGLKQLSRQEGVTLFMTILAAFNVLLYRYSGQEDIAIGSPIANRNQSEIEDLIGFFVNTLVLRNDLSGNPSFKELLGRVREATLGAYDHQDLPFEKLVEELRPARDLSYSPLFQVMFVWQNIPRKPVELPDLTLTPVAVPKHASMFDMTLYMWESQEGLSGVFEYNTDLFDRTTIVRMARHLEVLLEAIVENPAQRISRLSVLTKAQRQQLLEDWNDTQADYPADRCLQELFEAQAERTPEAVAVVFEDKQLEYRELNRRANQLAHHLRSLAVGPETLVGIYMKRSIEMVVGLLGILKAGGAYVPLDPDFPRNRLEFMLEDSGAPILLTQSDLAGNLSEYQGNIFCIDTDWEEVAKESQGNPTCVAMPENLAYVIYTSGSTGKPKGVQIAHRALVNFLFSMRRQPGLSSEDIMFSVTTISFDIFGLELFMPLITGAKVVLASRDEVIDGARLIELLRQSHASVVQATPATWRLLLEAGWEGDHSLKILCGGEALPQDLVTPLLDKCKELWNLYGPTETTIWSTVYRVRSKEEPILIGYPIANTQVYILGRSLQPVPVGVIGELYIGGDGLARGYLNRPELTAEKFIPHPFDNDPQARIYNTGDLARYQPDGKIECLGRVDHQVKVRGFRIELGEIEAVMSEYPGVKQSVAVVREDRSGDKRIVAYLVGDFNKEGDFSSSELRQFMKKKLPDYMIPSFFITLKTLPLTPNGKIDRLSLPEPDTVETNTDNTFVAPRNELEKCLTRIWEEVLSLNPIGVRDNFFELGGHSFLAVQLCHQVKKTFGKILPVITILEAPTVEQLAGILRQEGYDVPETSLPGSEPIRGEGNALMGRWSSKVRNLLSRKASG